MVVDVSNPASVPKNGQIDTPGYAVFARAEGDYAYVIDGSMGLQIVSLVNPELPELVSRVDTPGVCSGMQMVGVKISGDVAYLACVWTGLVVVDISDPLDPKIKAIEETPSYDVALELRDGFCRGVFGKDQGWGVG